MTLMSGFGSVAEPLDDARCAARERLLKELGAPDAALYHARAKPLSTVSRRAIRIAIVLALVAAAALAPSVLIGHKRVDLLQRAAAAVSTGPVLHVVEVQDVPSLAGGAEPTSSVVNLSNGIETPLKQTTEIWFNSSAELLHEVWSTNGAIWGELLATATGERRDGGPPVDSSNPPRVDPALQIFVDGGYQQALQSGAATITSHSTLEGRPVTWIRVPASGDAPATDVAVDDSTSAPVAVRADCAQCQASSTYSVASIEGLPAGQGDFSLPPATATKSQPDGNVALRPIQIANASTFLGHPAVWPGDRIEGLSLNGIEGASAADDRGVRLTYGGPSASGVTQAEPPLTVAEGTSAELGFSGFNFERVGNADAGVLLAGLPTPGSALLVPGDNIWHLQLRSDALLVEIDASTKDLALQAARDLRQMH